MLPGLHTGVRDRLLRSSPPALLHERCRGHPQYRSTRYAMDRDNCFFVCVFCVCIYILPCILLCGAALIRASGTTAYPGAVTTVPHGCPASIRASGTTAHPGAVTTVPHGCPAAIRALGITGHGRQELPPFGTPDRQAPGRGYARRTGTLRALLAGVVIRRADGTTGLRESRPGWGLRQQRRVHALFGRAGHHAPIHTHIYVLCMCMCFFDKNACLCLCRTHGHAPVAACDAHQGAGSAATVGDRMRGRTHTQRASTAPFRWVRPTHRSYAGIGWCLCLCICICVYILCGSALSRAIGTTAHPGAVATVPHGYPAAIRAVGTTAHPGAVATVSHGCPAAIRVVGTTARPGGVTTIRHRCPASIRALGTTGQGQSRSPPHGTPNRDGVGREQARRTGTLRALLAGVKIRKAVGTTGVGESRPGCGLRQQRRVHAVFGRAQRHLLIYILFLHICFYLYGRINNARIFRSSPWIRPW
jgi:hypothetical protein